MMTVHKIFTFIYWQISFFNAVIVIIIVVYGAVSITDTTTTVVVVADVFITANAVVVVDFLREASSVFLL